MKKLVIGMSLALSAMVAGSSYLYNTTNYQPSTSKEKQKAEDPLDTNVDFKISIPKNLSSNQQQLMKIAYNIAKEDGHKNPEIVQAVLLQETRAGAIKKYKVANPGKDAYFGLMQLKIAAARDVLSKHPDLWNKYDFHTKTDDEIKANLILNDYFNLEIGSKYLLMLKRQYGYTGRKLLNAYNRGPGGVKKVDDNYHYAVDAEKKLANYKANRI